MIKKLKNIKKTFLSLNNQIFLKKVFLKKKLFLIKKNI